MKKRMATMILCAAMTASILAGCGTGKESNAPGGTAGGTATGTSQDTAAAAQARGRTVTPLRFLHGPRQRSSAWTLYPELKKRRRSWAM